MCTGGRESLHNVCPSSDFLIVSQFSGITAPLQIISTCLMICFLLYKSSMTAEGLSALFLNIVCMLCTPTLTHTHTLLIIIGWVAWGMCPGKQKTFYRWFGRNWLPCLLICPPIFSFSLVQPGLCAFLCWAWSDETPRCAFCCRFGSAADCSGHDVRIKLGCSHVSVQGQTIIHTMGPCLFFFF